MGISFKVSKTGKRFNPKPLPHDASFRIGDDEPNDVVSKKTSGSTSFSTRKHVGEASEKMGLAEIADHEVSFSLNLFPDGYSISKPIEGESGRQTSVDVPKFLHPYDRASETLFSAIESGKLPGDILDDIPCKYVNGALICEVRDYRKCSPEGLSSVASGHNLPVINRVRLQMSLENIVKDIPAISDNEWTYGDLMEVESRILKALQPQLSLDPTPQLDKLSDNRVSSKLNLELRSMRRKRLRQVPELAVSTHNLHGKKVCPDRVPESSRLGDPGSLGPQPGIYENLNTQSPSTMLPLRNNSFGSDGSLLASPQQSKYQIGASSPRGTKDPRLASPGGQDVMIPFADNTAASNHGKREVQDGQLSSLTNKKARLDGNLQHLGPQMDNLHGSELHWKNTLMQQQSIGRGIQYANNGMQKFSQQVFEGGVNQEGAPIPFSLGQQGIRYNLKEEPVETERLDKPDHRMTMGESELSNIDPQQSRLQQQRMSHQFMRSGFPQSSWNNLGQPLDNNPRKEDSFQKRKLVQSPHVSAGGLPQSPLSSKSGEFSSGSHQFGAVVSSGVVSQREKSAVTSIVPNDSIQRQNQAQAVAKRRSNSHPKTPAIGGVASPASVSNMSVPINASSPPVGSQPLGDQTMLDRFAKIDLVTTRFQLNSKKNKVDEYPIRKPNAYSTQKLASHLSSDLNVENLKDETCKSLAKSLVGGNMNVCKTRILNFIQTERIIQGNAVQVVTKARTRMIMSEKPNDGDVAFHMGDIENAEYLAAEDYLPTLPTTHVADLLAEQFCSLMAREGYQMEDHHIEPRPTRMNLASVSGQVSTPTSEMQPFSEAVSSDIAKPSTTGNNNNAPLNSPLNVQGPRMLPPGNNNHAIQMSQGLSLPSRPQQLDQLPPQQPQQQQQFQRSPMMLPANSMQHLNNIAQNATNMQLGQHMTTKHSPLQLQILQQQSQQQRKMMPGLGNIGMGNIGNNMVGLGGLRSAGVNSGLSAAMGPAALSGLGSMGPNAMNLTSANLTNAIRSGALTAHQAAIVKMKMQQQAGRSNMMGASQPGIGGVPGANTRQMHPGGSSGPSMLGPAMNRASINQMQMQRMGQMGPPKLISAGMNLYMNQQQQFQLQQQQQQMQMQQQQQMQIQQQQQQQQQPQQETTSPLQAVLSPSQVGSPSSMGIAHQMNQLQQQQASPQQRTPMSPQLSSGAIPPASPQLSSGGMGSVGSIANSPMEMPGVNKSNSVNNAQ